jgi:hypothetical protein
VSWLCAIGTIPERLTRPSVGLSPTSPQACAGQTIEPSVSVPTATAARLAATAAPLPDDEPHGLRSSAYGFAHWPPRPLHPDDDCVERKFAHSDRLVFPRITAPASRSRRTTNASRGAFAPISASEPAVVSIRSAVATLSLISTGMPWSGPRTFPARRSSSSRAAMASASGLTSITERNIGSTATIRSRAASATERAV